MQSCVCEKEQTDPGVAFVIAKKKERRDENEKIQQNFTYNNLYCLTGCGGE